MASPRSRHRTDCRPCNARGIRFARCASGLECKAETERPRLVARSGTARGGYRKARTPRQKESFGQVLKGYITLLTAQRRGIMKVVQVRSNKAWRLECEALRQAIRDYDQAYNDVLNFTRAYLENGGDISRPPDEWAKLNEARDEKFAAMLKLAGQNA